MEIQKAESPEKSLEEGRKGQSPAKDGVLGNPHVGSDGRGNKKSILDPRKPFLQNWTRIFVLLCIIALLFDPLFFYIPVIDDGRKCIDLDKKLKLIALVLRSLTDAIYIIHIIFQFRSGYIIARPQDSKTEIVEDPWAIANKYMLSYFVIDILAVLPLPQVIILAIIPRGTEQRLLDAKSLLKFAILLQYVPRVFRIYPLYTKATWTSALLSKTAWTKAAFNLFLFILASHVLGAFWYFFSIERATTCWYNACQKNAECVNNSFFCGNSLITETNLADNCPIMPPNSTQFDFGIFLDALQSRIVESNDFPQKLIRCFWWGLQSLSSLGQNLTTSNYIWENCFAIVVTFIGLFLLLCVLGNLQLYLQFMTTKSEETRLEGHALEKWMASHSIPEDLRIDIRNHQQHRKQESSDIDVEKFFGCISDSKDLAKKVKQKLCLGMLRRVPVFGKLDDSVLDAISRCLKPKIYEEGSYYALLKVPIEEMLFIVKGKLTNVPHKGKTTILEAGDFCGDEIIKWALDQDKSSGHLPLSFTTVRALTKVEAFILSANDLKIVVSQHWKFSNLLSTDNQAHPPGKVRNRTHWEAIAYSLQGIRRYYRKRLTGSPPRPATEDKKEK